MQRNALRSAEIRSEEVPVPPCGPQHIVIANRYSLISAGTELTSVRSNNRNLVAKAVRDPEVLQSVLDMLTTDGVGRTADRIRYEMTKWSPLGYSGAGVAVEVGDEVPGVRPGDLVAYAGQPHAEYVRTTKNLCAPVPDGVSMREAATVALGSIALQAVRRADVQMGDVVAVLGVGLVGQLICQLLHACGARVVATDVLPTRLELARTSGVEQTFVACAQLPQQVLRWTNGVGADRVVICAGAADNSLIEQAIALSRDRGRIVVVGAVGLDVPREEFYRKELDLVISRSYGPGRYDRQYEEQGADYPIGYVRWTEQRNMQEFLRLIAAKKVTLDRLITHEFALADAAQGYEQLSRGQDGALGVLLRYEEAPHPPCRWIPAVARPTTTPAKRGTLAVIGCGAFARQVHLPNLVKSRRFDLRTVVASTGHAAKEAAIRYGAPRCGTDAADVWIDDSLDAVLILTRDKSHAELTIAALGAGKHVFCEKPLATTADECRAVAAAAAESDRICQVGFNRRFAPFMRPVKETLASCRGPKMIQYRVNAGALPSASWIYDSTQSAGRLVGEACHFIDLFHWLTGAEPVRVSAYALGECPAVVELEDVAAQFELSDGSLASLVYTARGASSFPKERLDVFCDGQAISIDDFRRLTIRGRQRIDMHHRRPDKGHAAELEHFADAIRGQVAPCVSARDGVRATLCCLRMIDSVRRRATLTIDPLHWWEGISHVR
jgi:predicted dehydrogenase/threonine dehydrogenase-like Zn-dependent dehydrogenase